MTVRATSAVAPTAPICAVLLAAYNPSHFLDEQIASIGLQDYENIILFFSDDSEVAREIPVSPSFSRSIRHQIGPKRGFAQNFRSLLESLDAEASFAAFSDQDDVWEPEKLSRAIDQLAACDPDIPTAYCSRTMICDEALNYRGLSRVPQRPLGFAHALVQNIMVGNSIVLNRSAIELLKLASRRCGNVPAHDWWIYQVITGCGGRVIFDPIPSVRYRQHGSNIIGANSGVRATFNRVRLVFCGKYRSWSDQNLAALKQVDDLLIPACRATLKEFEVARKRPLVGRLLGLRRAGVYRQNLAETLTFWLAAALGRV